MPGAVAVGIPMISNGDNFQSRIAAGLIFAGHGAGPPVVGFATQAFTLQAAS